MVSRFWILSIATASVALLFNNCARMAQPEVSGEGSADFLSSLSSSCGADLKSTYVQTYYPLLRTNCQACHSNAHGSADVNTSFNAFMNYSSSMIGAVPLLEYQATHAHGGNSLGPHMQPAIDAIKPQWTAAMARYESCLAEAPASSGDGPAADGGVEVSIPSAKPEFTLVDKSVTGLEATRTNATMWRTLSWQTDRDTATADQQNKLMATLSIEVRYFVSGTSVMGLMFRNPKIRASTGQESFYLKGLALKIEGVAVSTFTTYKMLDTVVSGTAEMSLAAGSAPAVVIAGGITDQTKVAFEIVGLQVGLSERPSSGGVAPIVDSGTGAVLGAVIRFSDLIGKDAAKAVIANRCSTCHGTVNPQKNLNLTSYASASAASNTIQSRINDTAKPMPPSGLLPSSERSMIEAWIRGGKLQ